MVWRKVRNAVHIDDDWNRLHNGILKIALQFYEDSWCKIVWDNKYICAGRSKIRCPKGRKKSALFESIREVKSANHTFSAEIIQKKKEKRCKMNFIWCHKHVYFPDKLLYRIKSIVIQNWCENQRSLYFYPSILAYLHFFILAVLKPLKKQDGIVWIIVG